jgi:hypothetical protein
MLVFNPMHLLAYWRLKLSRKLKYPCGTIIAFVSKMFPDIGAIPKRIHWQVLANASTS